MSITLISTSPDSVRYEICRWQKVNKTEESNNKKKHSVIATKRDKTFIYDNDETLVWIVTGDIVKSKAWSSYSLEREL